MNNNYERQPPEFYDDNDAEYGHHRSQAPWFKGIALVVVVAFLALAFPNILQMFKAGPVLKQDPALLSDPLAQAALPAIVLVQARTENGLAIEGKKGTGFNIREDGAVITNEHVVEGAFSVSVVFSDDGVYYTNRWEKVGDADLVVLDIMAQNLPLMDCEDYLPQSGQSVTVIGNPLDMERLIQKGEITTVVLPLENESAGYFEILVTAEPGLSGSPVIDDKGSVIGVVYAARHQADKQDEKTALAIPLATVLPELQAALERLE